MNVVLITADDCSAYSINCDFSPNVYNFGKDACQFLNAHCNITFCQPSRSVLMTGLYPQNNGSTKFCPIKEGINTLPKILKSHGYFTAIMGKYAHHKPYNVYQWNFVGNLSNEKKYLHTILSNLDMAIKNEPFFISLNLKYPHRPFIESNEVFQGRVPVFLKNDIHTRKELANYYKSIAMMDFIFGRILDVLPNKDTIVIFTSDHGMSFPFAKGNCYHYSTNIPLIYRVGNIKRTNTTHLVSHVDITPTVLDLLNIETKINFDGRSYKKLIETGSQDNFNFVYAQLNNDAKGDPMRMRALISEHYSYVINIDEFYSAAHVDGWGWHKFIEKYQFPKRAKEELIELTTNRDVADVENKVLINMRSKLFQCMKKHNDPMVNLAASKIKDRILI